MIRLRDDITLCTTTNGLVLLDERAGVYWQLNSTGAVILRALLDGLPPDTVSDELARTRPVGARQAASDIAVLVRHLTAAGLVVAR